MVELNRQWRLNEDKEGGSPYAHPIDGAGYAAMFAASPSEATSLYRL